VSGANHCGPVQVLHALVLLGGCVFVFAESVRVACLVLAADLVLAKLQDHGLRLLGVVALLVSVCLDEDLDVVDALGFRLLLLKFGWRFFLEESMDAREGV